MFTYMKDTWEFFGRSSVMSFICVAHNNIFHIELAANSSHIFIILNL